MTVGVPNVGNARCFLENCVYDGMVILKINVSANVSILFPSF